MEASNNTSGDNLVLGLIAGAVVGLIGIGIWMGCYKVGASGFAIMGWLGGPIIGAGVGLVIRKVGRSPQLGAAIGGIVITFFSCAIGYVVTDMVLVPWQPPSDLPQAIKNFGGDLQAWLLIAIGCYIAFAIARQRPSVVSAG